MCCLLCVCVCLCIPSVEWGKPDFWPAAVSQPGCRGAAGGSLGLSHGVGGGAEPTGNTGHLQPQPAREGGPSRGAVEHRPATARREAHLTRTRNRGLRSTATSAGPGSAMVEQGFSWSEWVGLKWIRVEISFQTISLKDTQYLQSPWMPFWCLLNHYETSPQFWVHWSNWLKWLDWSEGFQILLKSSEGGIPTLRQA